MSEPSSEDLRLAAELVYHGIDLRSVAGTPVIDTTTTCPRCGHHEAAILDEAQPSGFVEECCECAYRYVDPTP